MEFELKYLVANHALEPAIRYITATCQADPAFQSAIISSIYYDDLGLNSLSEKVNSDFYKTKYRIRWYQDTAAGQSTNQIFIEVKDKSGAKRIKQRYCIEQNIQQLGQSDLGAPFWMDFSSRFSRFRKSHTLPLFPMLEVRYRRRRFIDPYSGCRLSIDSDIEIPRVNNDTLPMALPTSLQSAVIEIKGGANELPPSLRPLVRLGARKSSFSKYHAGYARIHSIVFDPR